MGMALALGLLAALAGCNSSMQEREPAVGEAWVAPATLAARKELSLHSPVAVTLVHGDKVELLARRRRFLKIRAANGAEAWTDSRLLLSARTKEDFEALQERAQQAAPLGQATVLDTITVHTAPFRQAPGLLQIAAKSTFDVVAHQRVERIPWDPPPLLEDSALKPKIARKKKEVKLPPPPPGPPPPVPEDWLLLSGYAADKVPGEKPNEPPPAPPAMDEWSVVRVPDGRAGWVLDRLLYMAIPDEVAQYAERARIVDYFKIGEIRDKEKDVVKPVWLWATQSSAGRESVYDSLRIFVWSVKHHRYETSWIERGISGAGAVTLTGKRSDPSGFSTLVYEKDGRLTRRDYTLQNYRARLAARAGAAPPAPWYVTPAKRGAAEGLPEAPGEAPNLWQNLRRRIAVLRAPHGH
jgi:hypothetical protein